MGGPFKHARCWLCWVRAWFLGLRFLLLAPNYAAHSLLAASQTLLLINLHDISTLSIQAISYGCTILSPHGPLNEIYRLTAGLLSPNATEKDLISFGWLVHSPKWHHSLIRTEKTIQSGGHRVKHRTLDQSLRVLRSGQTSSVMNSPFRAR